MTGVEFDFVVTDCLEALSLYESIFEVKRVEVTELKKGQNEAVFTIYDTRFHMLDENEEYQLFAPKPGVPQSFWFNILVEDIADTYKKAMDAGCSEIQPVTEVPGFGCSNAMFSDKFGYIWMLHELREIVSFEERMKIIEEQRGGNNN